VNFNIDEYSGFDFVQIRDEKPVSAKVTEAELGPDNFNIDEYSGFDFV
jgi:hypothetical protein